MLSLIVTLSFTVETITIISVYIKILIILLVLTLLSHQLFHQGMFLAQDSDRHVPGTNEFDENESFETEDELLKTNKKRKRKRK